VRPFVVEPPQTRRRNAQGYRPREGPERPGGRCRLPHPSTDKGDPDVNDRLRSTGRRTLGRLSTTKLSKAVSSKGEIVELRRRVRTLETEMQEARRLNRRLAELTDIVQELLVPLAQRDEEKVNKYLERYSSTL
jgi:hypothetical protein